MADVYAVVVASMDGSGEDSFSDLMAFGPYDLAGGQAIERIIAGALRRTGEYGEVQTNLLRLNTPPLTLSVGPQDSAYRQLERSAGRDVDDDVDIDDDEELDDE